jgi:glucan phosphoethanolaminetransferase (alkaline phosphatase superfamily)
MKLKNGIKVKWFEMQANDEFYSVLDEIKTEKDVETFIKWLNDGIKEVKGK